eukprot:TRINITY_DN5999_c0_g1_i6.p2 TRINITY_DN5999_c0_g1~~TRINITY_DN5999_c0_g1_i6.p2  ORF type:complete len:146 (-),score=39.05 TRINITY_DN5999_c0_g1_i6:276-713(-)
MRTVPMFQTYPREAHSPLTAHQAMRPSPHGDCIPSWCHSGGLPKDRIRALATEYELQIRGLVGMVGGVVVPQWELQVYHDLPEFGYNFDTLLLIWFPSKQAFYQLATSAQYEEVYDRHIAEVHAHIMLALKPFRLDTGMLYGGEL